MLPNSPAARRQIVAAVVVATLTALLYRSTMHPGFDLGDTPSFQTMAGSPFVSPRDAYPLYFVLAAPMVWLTGDRAGGMNLATALEGAAACGVLLLVGVELTGAVLPATAAALAFAGSYTFWSQSVTAEVYALHVLCLAGVVLALLRWERRPTRARLALVFLVGALSFGNHLTTALWLPGALLFVLAAAPGGVRSLLEGRVLLVALGCALIGAAPYLWTVHTMLIGPDAPAHLADALRLFWFDVTKSDWRATMVLELPASMASARAGMFAFDVGQQFRWLLPICVAGAIALAVRAPRRFLLLATCYLVSTAFALTYSVGDTHVFLLPSHAILAMCAAPGVAWLMGLAARVWSSGPTIVAVSAILAAALRIYEEYPALDRSDDRRAHQTLDALTGDLRDNRAVLLGDMEWQLQNGLNYYAARSRSDLAFTTAAAVLPYAPVFVRDNLESGREIVLTDRARARLVEAYGPLVEIEPDERVSVPSLRSRLDTMAPGTRYVACVIRPVPEFPLDRSDIEATLSRLSGGAQRTLPAAEFVVIAGLAGAPPVLVRAAGTPFRAAVALDGLPVEVRMESWLPFDTIRRMGFGHVIAGRQHALIVERGVSVVAVDGGGRPLLTAYAAGLYAPQPRFRLSMPR